MRLPNASGIVERAVTTPQGWPVRWRLAAVSAALTLVILLGFSAVVGRLTANKLESDFRDDVRGTGSELALRLQLGQNLDVRPDLTGFTMAEGAHARVVTATGEPLQHSDSNTPNFGLPEVGVHSVGSYEVATTPIATNQLGIPQVFLQYGEDHDDVQNTIDRLWLFLGAGVLVGTVLAYLAGLAVASRAMRPISSLTAAAREIASTRDPSGRMPTLRSD